MAELLENSDNTNADIGVSESPANEAAISLTAVQALADALQKIESYTPTAWVDNESPDIDAAHLNKAEQAIMRVTTAMNSAVDVIKDLQSQVNTTNNNLSDKFAAKDISDGSLNQITTTGFYFGSNITEVTPYIKSHKWCLINAYVSGNSASIFVTAGDAMALSIYRNSDGIYSYYPIATKSDLTWNPVSISELNTNAVIPDGGLNNGANIYVSCGRLHIISLSLNLSSDINGSLFKVETGHIPVRSTRIVCTAKSGNITAMPYLDSDGYVITAGTIPAGQVKLLGIYMTAS